MDEDRLGALLAKRATRGLSDREAAELGRLVAEREGKPYGVEPPPPAPTPTGTEPFRGRRTRDQERALMHR